MYTTSIKYEGQLRTICKHNYSNSNLITDAPIDNMGKGESFSPTDLVVTALGSCILTIMGIYCQNNKLKFDTASIDVLKVMDCNPRRISKIDLNLTIKNDWSDETLIKVLNALKSCPVMKSLNDDIKISWKINS